MDVLLAPDEVLLRRFGHVRAVGGGAYILVVLVLWALYGTQVWPLLLGVPVLAVVTTAYFVRSARAPRTMIVLSLIADALVLGGAVAYVGGTGSGLVMSYAIVIVSAGILLGPGAGRVFTAFCIGLGLAQLLMEQAGFPPALLHRPELSDRGPVLAFSLAVLASVGFLTDTYASRLHELISETGAEAEAMRSRGRRRRTLVKGAAESVAEHLQDLEAVAEIIEERWQDLRESERARLAGRMRMDVTALHAGVDQLTDVGTMDATQDTRPEPVLLRRVVHDVLVALGDRLGNHVVDVDVPPLKVVGNRRAARRVVYNVMENVVEHTPAGTTVQIRALTTGGQGVLVLTDDGPGIPPALVDRLFDPPDERSGPHVGLPLVRELCDAMSAECRYEPGPGGGTRFLIAFRLAPSAAPTPGEEPTA